jgi:hypothetical protein
MGYSGISWVKYGFNGIQWYVCVYVYIIYIHWGILYVHSEIYSGMYNQPCLGVVPENGVPLNLV